jgi:23S rRNA pseudouridine2605 synthase
MPEGVMRLDRLLSDRGLGSRRDVQAIIRKGRVQIGDRVERDPGCQVAADARVLVDGEAVAAPPLLAVFHKPYGIYCTVGDPQGRPNLQDAAAPLIALGLHPVGRLDHDSEGLLPWSRSGALTQRLLHPKFEVPKHYAATVENDPPADLADLLRRGVPTALGPAMGELDAVDGQTLHVVMREGRNRIVRRMLANVGLPVQRLVRLGFGELTLGTLAPGEWRVATPTEQAWAERLIAPKDQRK